MLLMLMLANTLHSSCIINIMEVYLHAYCKNNYGSVILSKIRKFREAGLWESISSFNIPVSGRRDIDEEFLSDLASLSPKINIFEHQNPVFNNEPDTLNYIRNRVENFEQNTPILYMHTKGVSWTDPTLRRNIDGWVRYLDLYTIAKWKECIRALETHDVASGLFSYEPMKHFSGNFWWANSDYLKTLPYLDKENIKPLERGEFWICSGDNAKIYPVAMNAPVNLYQNYYCIESDFPQGF